MSVYPNNRITLNLTTVNAVRPLRGRCYLRIHTASSASLHMRLSNVGRLRRPATHCCHPKGLWMNPCCGSSAVRFHGRQVMKCHLPHTRAANNNARGLKIAAVGADPCVCPPFCLCCILQGRHTGLPLQRGVGIFADKQVLCRMVVNRWLLCRADAFMFLCECHA